MRLRPTLLLLLLWMLPVAAVTAQEKGDVGIAAGYPTAIGLIWHASSGIALKADIAVSKSSSDYSSGTSKSGSDGWSFGLDVSGRIRVRTWTNLSAYVAPGFPYTKTSIQTTTEYTGPSLPGQGNVKTTTTTTGRVLGASGAFGTQYMLSDQFSVFGDMGFGYTRTTGGGATDLALSLPVPSSPATRSEGRGWGTRTRIGVVLYF